jgi:hypothetical protein
VCQAGVKREGRRETLGKRGADKQGNAHWRLNGKGNGLLSRVASRHRCETWQTKEDEGEKGLGDKRE